MIDASSTIDYLYKDFIQGIDTIVNQIVADQFEPDYIVGIVRGGAVPAVYLSHKLNIPMTTINWNTRDKGLGNESSVWCPKDLLDGKQILIVDDIVDGGITIKEVLADWEATVKMSLPLHNIRLCAMFYNVDQDIKPNYYHKTIDRSKDSRWILFPWETRSA